MWYHMAMQQEIENLKAEIVRLNDKICVMRSILWEWNPSSGPVWEYHRLKKIGERDIDYSFLADNNNHEEPAMPLFDYTQTENTQ